MKARKCSATCFSLFPDVGMASVLDVLDSTNGGKRKCIVRIFLEICSFKEYRKSCIFIAIIDNSALFYLVQLCQAFEEHSIVLQMHLKK
jgi:hypothetical protein